jgi:hypothetical protein
MPECSQEGVQDKEPGRKACIRRKETYQKKHADQKFGNQLKWGESGPGRQNNIIDESCIPGKRISGLREHLCKEVLQTVGSVETFGLVAPPGG